MPRERPPKVALDHILLVTRKEGKEGGRNKRVSDPAIPQAQHTSRKTHSTTSPTRQARAFLSRGGAVWYRGGTSRPLALYLGGVLRVVSGSVVGGPAELRVAPRRVLVLEQRNPAKRVPDLEKHQQFRVRSNPSMGGGGSLGPGLRGFARGAN